VGDVQAAHAHGTSRAGTEIVRFKQLHLLFMDISIVIVAWNAQQYLELCLESLVAAPPHRSMEVIVVDNASSDGTCKMIEARYSWVKLIRSPENLGFSRGNNLGIRQCQGCYIALVNPDVQILPGCLDALADFLEENPTVGNVGPRVLNPDGTLQSSCRRFPTLWNNFCAATSLTSVFKGSRLFAGEHMFYFSHDRIMAVDVLVGCFSMIRREAFDGVGLLDENLFMYGDDVDWCRRAWTAGWKVVFFPGAQVIHDRGKITAPYPVRFAVAQQRSILYYWAKHHGRLRLLGIRNVLFCHHLMRYLFGVLSRLVPLHRWQPNDDRRRITKACLRALVSEGVQEDE
jgi:GT2 family glycosyltransferase